MKHSRDLSAVHDAQCRPIHIFLSVSQTAHYIGAGVLLSSPPQAGALLAARGPDADWFKDALKDKGVNPCMLGRKSRGKPIKPDKRR